MLFIGEDVKLVCDLHVVMTAKKAEAQLRECIIKKGKTRYTIPYLVAVISSILLLSGCNTQARMKVKDGGLDS